MTSRQDLIEQYQDDIAVIAMAGRFPGANSVEAFWQNLEQEVESITFFTQQQLLQAGVDPALLENPNFVGAEGVLPDVDKFDAQFFGFSPREAELLDPQHRIFLETIWELLERAGYSSEHTKEVIGVYSGAGASSYLSRNLLTHPEFVRDVGTFKVSLATGQDFVSTRASYKLGLTGPSININTLCSSSAVAVHYAREALLAYQCDIAVAGGVTISNSREDALFYQEGGIGSFDGHCRTFDARAAGTVAGNGIALVALKRMEDALVQGDQIVGVIRGTAINNDGGDKSSYTAPSPEGQARVITEALEVARVHPETISYIEAHGTATNLGDPIEVAGLTRAYSRYTDKRNYCGIGSVKSNIGHLVAAGGVASMIKTLMGMQQRKIPASLNFEKPNPKIDFANSPFYVVDKTREWLPTGGEVLRAGVSSFGIGGTNAHIILEQAPAPLASDTGRAVQTIILSAKTATALNTMKLNLLEHLRKNPQLNLADIAFTLQMGRHSFDYRFATSVASVAELMAKLDGTDTTFCAATLQKNTARELCFMFPGQGSQYINMGRSLYLSEPVFQQQVDRCAALLKPLLQRDLLALLYPAPGTEAEAQLRQTAFAQVALFVTEYALAQLWISWGIKPAQMIGHSIGEYVAACLAGVFSVEDALRIVVRRSELMAQLPAGAMISVPLDKQALQVYLQGDIACAVQNSPESHVLAGPEDAIEKVMAQLTQAGISATRLHTSHAFHSQMMEPALAPFAEFLAGIPMQPPALKFISNLSGTWAGAEVATPEYWVQHLRQTVKFSDGIKTLLAADAQQFFLEVGPGQTLASLVRSQGVAPVLVASSLPQARQAGQALWQVNAALGSIWLAGNTLDWAALYSQQQRQRLCLPTYPFERQRYWIDPAPRAGSQFQPDLVLSASPTCEPPAGDVAQGALRIELKRNRQANKPVSAAQWQALVDLQTELVTKMQTLMGDSFTVGSSGLELRLLQEQTSASATEVAGETSLLSTGHSRPQGAPSYTAPQTPTQSKLAAHWQDVLGYAPVGIHDNFFEVGGHSLMAAALVTRARKDFDLSIPLRELLEAPTIAELSELIENRLWLQQNPSRASDAEVLEL